MNILVTGGAGYIGSHTTVELLNAGYQVVVVDNLVNSKEQAIQRIQEITGKQLAFHKIDLLDKPALEAVFAADPIDAVIHFAALKAVGESVEQPLRYYHNNLTGTINLLEVMKSYKVKNLVFSSSATVYGENNQPPLVETMPTSAINPSGWTKVMMEQIMNEVYLSDKSWNFIMLRYFNPVGAHISGKIGEDPNGIPSNLFPAIAQVLVGKLPGLRVWGNDYPTPDGTPLRDYIHVVDLATGHLAAIKKLETNPGFVIYNLGTGRAYSVFEVVKAFSKVAGKEVPYKVYPRRPGDLPTSFADPSMANRELCWKAERGLDQMCADMWRWQTMNPNGY